MNGPLPAELKFWENTDFIKCQFHSLQEARRKKKKKRTHTSDAVVSIFNLSNGWNVTLFKAHQIDYIDCVFFSLKPLSLEVQ